MRELSLFSGVGGGLLGSLLLGHKIIGAVEIDEYCCKVLEQRQKDGILPYFPIFQTDIRDFIRQGYASLYKGKCDLISAGFPCQPFSVAGKRKGRDDNRNMWPETIKIIRQIRPRYAFLENVRGLLSSSYFQEILKDLAESGYDARWRVLSAAEVGAPHKRDRLWIVAYTDSQHGFRWGKSQQSISKSRKIWTEFSGSIAEISNSPIDGLEKGWETTRLRSERFAENTWWQAEPRLDRLADRLPYRVDRLKAAGNAQVPAVVREAWRLLTEGLV